MSTSLTVRVGGFTLFFLLAISIVFGGGQQPAYAVGLPFDYPASGTEILCYLNGLEEQNGVPVVRPPFPVFNVGECADQGGETNPPPPPPPPAEEDPVLPQCSDGIDNDADGLVDSADPSCHTDFDASNASSYDPNLNNEAAVAPQCSDGIDNDGDGLVDSADPSCHTDFNAGNAASYDPALDNEAAVPPQCSDGIDNDGDELIDMDDPGCSGASDNDETDPSSGGGRRGGGSSSSAPESTGIVLGFSTTTESCDRYLTAFIREGHENDTDQVRRLQRFMRDFESAPVAENGTYDNATLASVHSFQTKYGADILTPWGLQESTGYVYLTTRKKVNEIFCKYTKTFFLTVEEEQKIKAAREAAAAITPRSPSVPWNQPTSPSPAVAPTTQEAGEQTTTVGGVLDFLRGLFGR